MGYTLNALLGHLNVLEVAREQSPLMIIVPLKQNIGIIPIDEDLREQLWDKPSQFDLFYSLSDFVMRCAIHASSIGYIAYVDAEYLGGTGFQAAIAWKNQKVVFEPTKTYTKKPKIPANPLLRLMGIQTNNSKMPINRVLRLMGVQVHNAWDEFEAVGLNAHRHTEDWLNPK